MGLFDSVTDTVNNAADTVTDAANDVADTVSDAADNIADTVTDAANDVADTFSDTANDVTDTFSNTASDVTDTFSDVANNVAEQASDTASDVTNNNLSPSEIVANKIPNTSAEELNNVADTVSDTAEDVAEQASNAAEDVAEEVAETGEDVADTVSDSAEDAADTVSDTAEDIAETGEDAVEETTDKASDVAEDIAETSKEVAEQASDGSSGTPAGTTTAGFGSTLVDLAEGFVEGFVDNVGDQFNGNNEAIQDSRQEFEQNDLLGKFLTTADVGLEAVADPTIQEVSEEFGAGQAFAEFWQSAANAEQGVEEFLAEEGLGDIKVPGTNKDLIGDVGVGTAEFAAGALLLDPARELATAATGIDPVTGEEDAAEIEGAIDGALTLATLGSNKIATTVGKGALKGSDELAGKANKVALKATTLKGNDEALKAVDESVQAIRKQSKDLESKKFIIEDSLQKIERAKGNNNFEKIENQAQKLSDELPANLQTEDGVINLQKEAGDIAEIGKKLAQQEKIVKESVENSTDKIAELSNKPFDFLNELATNLSTKVATEAGKVAALKKSDDGVKAIEESIENFGENLPVENLDNIRSLASKFIKEQTNQTNNDTNSTSSEKESNQTEQAIDNATNSSSQVAGESNTNPITEPSQNTTNSSSNEQQASQDFSSEGDSETEDFPSAGDEVTSDAVTQQAIIEDVPGLVSVGDKVQFDAEVEVTGFGGSNNGNVGILGTADTEQILAVEKMPDLGSGTIDIEAKIPESAAGEELLFDLQQEFTKEEAKDGFDPNNLSATSIGAVEPTESEEVDSVTNTDNQVAGDNNTDSITNPKQNSTGNTSEDSINNSVESNQVSNSENFTEQILENVSEETLKSELGNLDSELPLPNDIISDSVKPEALSSLEANNLVDNIL